VTSVYKLLPLAEWDEAKSTGVFSGSGIDLVDGYIHLSAADQAQETARLHFVGQDGLVLLRIEASTLGEALKWEASRGGALFPHLFGDLRVEQVAAVTPAPLDAQGVPDLGLPA